MSITATSTPPPVCPQAHAACAPTIRVIDDNDPVSAGSYPSAGTTPADADPAPTTNPDTSNPDTTSQDTNPPAVAAADPHGLADIAEQLIAQREITAG